MFSKNKKQLTQDDIKKINLAKKIQSNLPSDLIENDKENKANQSSNRYKIERTVEEDSDFNINNNIINNPKIYKFGFIIMILNFIIMLATPVTLLIRPDTKFFASSPDGRTWELNTRKNPDGSFVIKEYKGR
jgi:hypothetical protein